MSSVSLFQEWTKLEKLGGSPWPVSRDSHGACCLNNGEEQPQLLVTGGVDDCGSSLSDAWVLDVNSRRWREVSGVKWFNYLSVYCMQILISIPLFRPCIVCVMLIPLNTRMSPMMSHIFLPLSSSLFMKLHKLG